MHVLIDLTNMRFVYAHENQRLLSSLCHIELNECATLLGEGCSQYTYARFTDLELKLLYRNTFGVDSIFGRGGTIQVIMDNVPDLPQVDADPYEALMQADSIADNDDWHYRYLKGSMKPQMLEEAFTYVPLRMKHIPTQAPKPAASPVAAPPAGDRPAVGTVPAPRPAAAPSAPRQGGTTAIIWQVADAMWEAAGKPTALPTVLALRKTMMSELEAKHNVKKTTSSTSLGNWQKARLP